MKRSSPSLHLFAVAATNSTSGTSTAMSSLPSFRGGRGRGQNRGRRSYSDRSTSDCEEKQFVTGDSHFGQVRDTNRSFRPQNNRGSFGNFPPPPSYNHNIAPPPPPSYRRVPPPQSYNRVPPPESYNLAPPPPYYNLHRPLLQQPFDQNQQFYRPPPPRHSDLNQQFRPRWQHQQQFKPRPPKDLEYRNWQYANPGPPPELERFTILSYNILADYLARDHWDKLYFHIPRHFLDWERRKRSILFELGLWSADIMCLQEVDRFQDLKEELELRGYNGIWKMRTGDPVDGCATFWRNTRFKLLYEESLEFSKLGLRDNVAQICVFESLDQCNNNGTSAPTSLANAKKLVVCNIHVLFNPKRGEIKLGQIRVLLSRANAVSKLWDDAPLVFCGDFNSTPGSPVYNFISEQKLDLSELPRDKVSGQASAEIHLSRPYNPKYGVQCTENFAPVLPAFSNRKEMDRDHALDLRKPEGPDKYLGNGPFKDSLSQSTCYVIGSNECPISMKNSGGNNDKPVGQCDSLKIGEMKSKSNISHEVLEESTSLLSDDAASSTSPVQGMISGLTLPDSCHKDIHCNYNQHSHINNVCTSSNILLINTGSETVSNCSISEFDSTIDYPCNSISTAPGNRGTSSLSVSTKPPFPHQFHCALDASVESAGDFESTSTDVQLDEKIESLSLKEDLEGTKEGEGIGEDDITFLSELHHGTSFPSHSDQFEDESVKDRTNSDSQELHSVGGEISDNTSTVDWESNAVEKSKYDPSAWTPVEIETASGSPDCVVMEHALKLRSVYGEVQDSSGTRDTTGEPAVTSYHRRFMGTVDYMWRSEGLQTARVLAPIPKHAMLWTKGFPTKKWGSDHIALVSELAFTEDDTSRQNTESSADP